MLINIIIKVVFINKLVFIIMLLLPGFMIIIYHPSSSIRSSLSIASAKVCISALILLANLLSCFLLSKTSTERVYGLYFTQMDVIMFLQNR